MRCAGQFVQGRAAAGGTRTAGLSFARAEQVFAGLLDGEGNAEKPWFLSGVLGTLPPRAKYLAPQGETFPLYSSGNTFMSSASQILKNTSMEGLFFPLSISLTKDCVIPTSFASLYWLNPIASLFFLMICR